jgi:hypothetical protein
MHGAVAHLDFLLRLLEIFRVGISREVLVCPSVRADCHPSFDDLFGYFGMPDCMLTDLKERGFQTLLGQCLEHRRCVFRPGPVVESQNNFLVAQKIVLLEVFEAKSGSARRVDFDDA